MFNKTDEEDKVAWKLVPTETEYFELVKRVEGLDQWRLVTKVKSAAEARRCIKNLNRKTIKLNAQGNTLDGE